MECSIILFRGERANIFCKFILKTDDLLHYVMANICKASEKMRYLSCVCLEMWYIFSWNHMKQNRKWLSRQYMYQWIYRASECQYFKQFRVSLHAMLTTVKIRSKTKRYGWWKHVWFLYCWFTSCLIEFDACHGNLLF